MAAVAVETPQAAAARFLTSLHHPSHILVAISGGSDSTGLLVALADEIGAGHHPHTLCATTVDHGLRPESRDEANAVAGLCEGLGIVHLIRHWEGAKPASGLMAAAREARYALLAGAAKDLGADLIVTGHTLDDQRETLTMRSARRATAAPLVEGGLLATDDRGAAAGIADAVLFDRRIWVVRPFLNCRRADIRAELVARRMGWIDDPSNADLHYERVRVRADLKAGDGAAMPANGNNGRRQLSETAACWIRESTTIHAGLLCRIDSRHIDARSPTFGYALGYLTAVFGGQPFALGLDKLQRLLAFVGRAEPGRRTAGGVVFDLRRDGLYLMRESRNIAALWLPAGARGVWDGRFDVLNEGRRAVHIVAAAGASALSFPAGMPKGAVMRAAASAPGIFFDADGPPENDRTVTITPRLAPFDRFLTRFDLTLANQLSMSFGRTAYLSPPL